ncbi:MULTISPECIES: complex I NDUFA9 subunit family protein [unclassified Mesorhizobium]|uniref:complex I NDUFA9 subunit family protein n=1 Tax=unclassified Mesorhizobium TaxID=325217 RepID=UPI000BAF7CA1|nr:MULTISPECIES: complex I NDUFA9 subunit family protein [unclassified Mesorhizobium]TGT53382.1 complex I NDUFA9 subunit family protein [Mesorhizobium sp. M00.F.Ca.ET.170.01.1.1]AZO12743.1 complex I NDUFA9 subunit family protein [Mesorhizobium sp. M3A.F.Ca.ET.080.04.2.1]PBB87127.1 epimerase [Mesorhizobium sp. WSM3876]RWB71284.1 MAG: complex I NDUFA9 subunit family protein [Mesorhizobium sp.]RWB91250.1 MAG: complex I NDUFA9 subunit family protein [Mesorhizobium sp.]
MKVAVFGGTGFLGRRIVERLLDKGFEVRAVSRHARAAVGSAAKASDQVKADILDRSSIGPAIAGSDAVVNAVSLYIEHGDLTFERMHVAAAADLASAAREAGVKRLAHISGIGADPRSRSRYIKARGRGEDAVRNSFPDTIILRSAVMIGPDDAFLTTLIRLVRLLPIYPLFGQGATRLQPVYVGDVAEAVSRLLAGPIQNAPTFEVGGPRILRYSELVREIARMFGARPILVPMPFAAWSALAGAAEFLPTPALTRNQVDLMRRDNVATGGMPGLPELGIEPRDIGQVVRMIEERDIKARA